MITIRIIQAFLLIFFVSYGIQLIEGDNVLGAICVGTAILCVECLLDGFIAFRKKKKKEKQKWTTPEPEPEPEYQYKIEPMIEDNPDGRCWVSIKYKGRSVAYLCSNYHDVLVSYSFWWKNLPKTLIDTVDNIHKEADRVSRTSFRMEVLPDLYQEIKEIASLEQRENAKKYDRNFDNREEGIVAAKVFLKTELSEYQVKVV